MRRSTFAAGLLVAASLTHVASVDPAVGIPGLVRIASARSGDNSNFVKSATATCPQGKRVIGGGAVINDHGAGKVLLSQAQPAHDDLGDRYDVIGHEPASGFAGNWWIQAFALCAPEPAGYALITLSSGTPSSTRFKAAAVRCPVGTQALSAGGLVLQSSALAPNAGLQLVRVSGPRDIVRATGREGSGGTTANWTVLAVAVCAKPLPDSGVSAEVRTGVRATVTDCSSFQFVHGAGGGGSITDSGPVWLQSLRPSNDLKRVLVKMTSAPTAGMVAQAVCVP